LGSKAAAAASSSRPSPSAAGAVRTGAAAVQSGHDLGPKPPPYKPPTVQMRPLRETAEAQGSKLRGKFLQSGDKHFEACLATSYRGLHREQLPAPTAASVRGALDELKRRGVFHYDVVQVRMMLAVVVVVLLLVLLMLLMLLVLLVLLVMPSLLLTSSYDVVQAGGERMSKTFVRRILVGDAGITYIRIPAVDSLRIAALASWCSSLM